MKNKAFTLIELLVVVLIIGILAAIAVPQYQKAVAKSRATQLVLTSKALVDAQKTYFLQNGFYAENISDLDISFPDASGETVYIERDNISCSFSNQYKQIVCSMQQPAVIAFLRQYEINMIACYSYSSDNYKGDEICQLLLDVSNWESGCGGVCHQYKKYI